MTFLPFLTLTLQMVALLSLHPPLADAAFTFRLTDPTSGRQLECDRCPPGTYLRTRCTSTRKSACSPCPEGSFTEKWNHIDRCLRCGVCSQNQVVRQECNVTNNCQCECRPGFYYVTRVDMCLRHRECPPGEGVLTAGTPDKDTECHQCPHGSFSDVSSTHLNCTSHKSCNAEGQVLLLNGATWHDSVCAHCEELADGAVYIREILPAFFHHHKMSSRRLRQLVNHLPSENGGKLGGASAQTLWELQTRLNTWIASTAAPNIRKLPEILIRVGMLGTGERLQNKLTRTDANLKQVCGIGNEILASD